ncbi:MAG: ribosome-associated translation inhibitor RaiA [Dehalococcoidia bacterium]
MELLIKGKNLTVPENAKDYIEKKAQKFDRHLQSISKAKVEISEENTRSRENHYVVEVTVDSDGTFLRGEERGPDIFSAIDAVAAVMERQIKRYKDRLQGKKRYRTGVSKTLAPGEEANLVSEGENETGAMIKFKRFPVDPMPPEEAIDQMELLGHDFYIFFNSYSEQFAVVYKRGDSNYGLLEPELG